MPTVKVDVRAEEHGILTGSSKIRIEPRFMKFFSGIIYRLDCIQVGNGNFVGADLNDWSYYR